jgi:hypothetical protein
MSTRWSTSRTRSSRFTATSRRGAGLRILSRPGQPSIRPKPSSRTGPDRSQPLVKRRLGLPSSGFLGGRHWGRHLGDWSASPRVPGIREKPHSVWKTCMPGVDGNKARLGSAACQGWLVRMWSAAQAWGVPEGRRRYLEHHFNVCARWRGGPEGHPS